LGDHAEGVVDLVTETDPAGAAVGGEHQRHEVGLGAVTDLDTDCLTVHRGPGRERTLDAGVHLERHGGLQHTELESVVLTVRRSGGITVGGGLHPEHTGRATIDHVHLVELVEVVLTVEHHAGEAEIQQRR
jgi:hypothetical protein